MFTKLRQGESWNFASDDPASQRPATKDAVSERAWDAKRRQAGKGRMGLKEQKRGEGGRRGMDVLVDQSILAQRFGQMMTTVLNGARLRAFPD